MQINLQFSEREYLRGGASEIRFSEQKTKFPLRIFFRPPCILLPALNREGQGEGLYFRPPCILLPALNREGLYFRPQ